MTNAPYDDEVTGPPPVPGQVEMRLRGRPSDVDALVEVLSTCVPLLAETPRKHYRDADGKTVRRYLTVKPLHPSQAEEDGELPTDPAVDLRDFLVEIARHHAGTFELLAAAVKLADQMPGDEGRTKAVDRFLDALMAGGS